MPLEEVTTLDMVLREGEGELALVVTDAGVTTDPDQREQLFVAKIRNYMGFLLSDEFTKRFPDVRRDKVRFLVMTRLPPTPQMKEISTVQAGGLAVAVVFQELAGSG